MAKVSYARPNGTMKDINSTPRRKKVHRTNQCSVFLGGSFSNRDNVRDPRDSQYLTR